MVRQATSLTSSIRDIVSEPPWSLRVYDQLRNQWSGDRAARAATKTLPVNMSVMASSPAQGVRGMASSVTETALTPTLAMQTNIVDFRQLVIVSAVVAQAEAVAMMDFTTSNEATAAGDKLAQLLSEQAITAVENGQRELWRTLRDLRFAVVNDVRVRGAKLPDIRRLNTSVTTTAALLAWRETGNTENRDEIVAWNRLRDPAFILPTMPIEVIE